LGDAVPKQGNKFVVLYNEDGTVEDRITFKDGKIVTD